MSSLTQHVSLCDCQQLVDNRQCLIAMNQEKDDIEKSPETSKPKEEVDEVSLEAEGEESLEESVDITSLENELATLQDQHLRLQAEFDNYRKRMNARYEEVTRFASEGVIMKFLDIVDNLERALMADFKSDPDAAKEGISAIHKQIEKILVYEQVRPIVSVGKEFDPYYQNAIQTITDESLPDGQIVQEFQKGYMIRDKVLRPAMVSVNRLVDADTQPAEEDQTEEFTNENKSDDEKGDY